MSNTENRTLGGMTNQGYFDAIVERLDTLRVQPCPGRTAYVILGLKAICINGQFVIEGREPETHLRCHGTGFVTNPRYQAAWELLHYRIIEGGTILKLRVDNLFSGPWPDGAVRGLLEDVADAIWPYGNQPFEFGFAQTGCVVVGGKLRWAKDAQSLGQAILEALNEQH